MTDVLELTPRQERIAELYYVSNSVKFGSFLFSVHQDNPDLPPSPNKLHYPKEGEPGSEHLPELFGLVGDEFYDICEAHDPLIKPKRIAALPEGSWPLADSLARHYPTYPDNLLVFHKKLIRGISVFYGPEGVYQPGDEMLQLDDHTSAGRNAKIFRHTAKRAGLVVPYLLSVVDREQGCVANMAADGAELMAIFTVSRLLDYGVETARITTEQVEEAKAYNALNQFDIDHHVLPLIHDGDLLEIMRSDPLAVASCDFHEGFLADIIFAAPKGTYYDPTPRLVAFCGLHILKGEDVDNEVIPLVDQTGGYWTERRGYQPLLQRDNLENYEDVLRQVFFRESLRSLQLTAESF